MNADKPNWKLQVYITSYHSHKVKVLATKAALLSALVKCLSSTAVYGGGVAAAVGPTDSLDELDTIAKAVTEQIAGL